MRNHRYKLVRHDGVVEFYDLEEDSYEHKDLLEGELSARELAEFQFLKEELDKLRNSGR
jgi:hypothetical protein